MVLIHLCNDPDPPLADIVLFRFWVVTNLISKQRESDPAGLNQRLEKERVSARTLGPEGGWIVMSHIRWGGEQTTIYKSVKTFP